MLRNNDFSETCFYTITYLFTYKILFSCFFSFFLFIEEMYLFSIRLQSFFRFTEFVFFFSMWRKIKFISIMFLFNLEPTLLFFQISMLFFKLWFAKINLILLVSSIIYRIMQIFVTLNLQWLKQKTRKIFCRHKIFGLADNNGHIRNRHE